jgi:hypothetical protein
MGRRYCLSCSIRYSVSRIDRDGYLIEPVLPIRENECDRCGQKLVRREDDKEGVATAKIKEYRAKMSPLM